MQLLEAQTYEIRRSDEGDYIILIASMNSNEYLRTVDAIHMEIDSDILYIDYIINKEVKRTISFPDLPIKTIFGIKSKKSILITEIYPKSEVSYLASNDSSNVNTP
jgi:hypothetical protein